MKKTKLMRAALLLLVLTLITSCFVGGTFAKYTTKGGGNNQAHIAEFGVVINGSGNMFASEYDTDDENVKTTILKSVIANPSDTTKENPGWYTLAPGTKGSLGTITISGKPEVAVNIKYTAGIINVGAWLVDDEFYCPLVFTITKGTKTDTIEGLKYKNDWSGMQAKFNELINSDNNYAPNTELSKVAEPLQITWEWPFNSGDDAKDTELASRYRMVSFDVYVEVTQID